MTPPEILALAPPDILNPGYWPAWVALIVSGLVAFNKLIDESSKFAGFFGKWGKKLHDRSLSRHRIDSVATEFASAVESAVESARKKWQDDENLALRALDARLETVSEVTAQQKADIDDMRFSVRCMTAYTEYEADWHHRVNIMALTSPDNCIPIDQLPSHLDHPEFRALFKSNERWRDWSWSNG